MRKIGIVATIMLLMLFLISSVSATVTITGVSPLTANEDTTYTGTVAATSDNPPITGYSLTAGPAWLSVDSAGALTGTPLQADVGSNTFTVDVTDIDGTASNTFTIVVSAVNDAPQITSTPTTRVVEDQTYTYDVDATDEDDTTLVFSLTDSPDGMTIDSSTGVITWTPDDEDTGSNSVTVEVKDDESPTPASDTQSFSVFVRPDDVCEDYTSGSDIEIKDWEITDDDEDFYPGSSIEIEIEVENDGDDDIDDVAVEAILYDSTDGKRLDVVKSDEFDIDENEDETVELILEVPKDVDVENELIVFISSYEDGNDDENCDWKSESGLDFKRRKHDVTIEKVTISPSSVKAGKTVDVKVDVENVGDRNEDDVYVKVKNGELGIEKKSELFDIDSYEKGDDDEYSVMLTITVPSDAVSGDYDLEIYVFDEDNDVFESGEKFLPLTVEGTSSSSTSTGSDDSTGSAGLLKIEAAELPEEVIPGKAFQIQVKITNLGDESIVGLPVTVSNIADWAKSSSSIATDLLESGQTGTYYITITPKEDVAEGKHSVTITVKEGSAVVATKTLSLTVPEYAGTASPITGGTVIDTESEDEGTGFFNKLFSGTTLWIIGDLILIVIAIFFIKMLFSKRN